MHFGCNHRDVPADVTWGSPFTDAVYIPLSPEADGHHPHLQLTLYRKAQKCRFFDSGGEQYGPEHTNVAPALAWAYDAGFYDRSQGPGMGAALISEARSSQRPKDPQPLRRRASAKRAADCPPLF